MAMAMGDRFYSGPVGLDPLSLYPMGGSFSVDHRSTSHGRSRTRLVFAYSVSEYDIANVIGANLFPI